jgi:hypothetical protein
MISLTQENEGTDKPGPAGAPRGCLQFSLRSMFAVTFAVAMVCTLVFRVPSLVAVPLLALLSTILAAALTAIIIYGRNYQQTFAIGAVIPLSPVMFFLGIIMIGLATDPVQSWSELGFHSIRIGIVACWLSSILCGLVSVGVRRLVENPRR